MILIEPIVPSSGKCSCAKSHLPRLYTGQAAMSGANLNGQVPLNSFNHFVTSSYPRFQFCNLSRLPYFTSTLASHFVPPRGVSGAAHVSFFPANFLPRLLLIQGDPVPDGLSLRVRAQSCLEKDCQALAITPGRAMARCLHRICEPSFMPRHRGESILWKMVA